MAKRRYPQDVVWVQRDGTPIKLGEMTDTHLMNSHKMLIRSADKHHSSAAAGISYGGSSDSMGAYYAEMDGFHSLDKAIEIENRARILMDELRRRYPREENARSYVERLSHSRL